MARIPCAFSVQEEVLRQIDDRAAQLGMKRSEFILQALRKELLLNRGASMSIVAEPSPAREADEKASPAPKSRPYRIPRAPGKKKA